MRYLLLISLLFSGFAFAAEGDPIVDVEVIILKCPPSPCTRAIKTSGDVDRVDISGLPKGSRITALPQGWRVTGNRGNIITLQGSPVQGIATFQYESPDLGGGDTKGVSVAGYKGRNKIWNAGLLTRASAGITTMKAERVVGAPTAVGSGSPQDGATQAANSYKSSRSPSNRQLQVLNPTVPKKKKGIATAEDTVGACCNGPGRCTDNVSESRCEFSFSPGKSCAESCASQTSSTVQHQESDLDFLNERANAVTTGACCLQNDRCRDAPHENQCKSWRGEFFAGEACPAACQ